MFYFHSKSLSILITLFVFFLSFSMFQCSIDPLESVDENGVFNATEESPAAFEARCIQSLTDKVYKSLDKNSIKGLYVLFEKDSQLNVLGHESVPFAGTYSGAKEAKDYFKSFFNAIKIKDLTRQYEINQGDFINAHINMVAYVHKTKKTFDLEFVYAFELNEQKRIKSLSIYYDTNSLTRAFTKGGSNYITDFKGTNSCDEIDVSFDAAVSVQTLYYNLFVLGDIPSVLAGMDPNVEIVFKSPKETIPFAGIYNGQMGFVQFITNLVSSVTTGTIEYKVFIAEENRVDVLMHETTLVNSTGKVFSIDILHSVIFNANGQMIVFKSYNDSQAMVEKFQ